MKNKKVLITIVLAAGLILFSVFFYFRYQAYLKRMALTPDAVPASVAVSEEMTAWTDQSGFSFQYPKSLILNPHDEDKDNYAHVEFTSATYSGNLIVWAKDTTFGNVEDYAQKSKVQGFIDTTLGGEPAKKLLQNDVSKKITTSVIKDGYLYQIEANIADNDYWNKTFDKVSSTFKFDMQGKNNVEKPQPADEGITGGDVGGGEEVIE